MHNHPIINNQQSKKIPQYYQVQRVVANSNAHSALSGLLEGVVAGGLTSDDLVRIHTHTTNRHQQQQLELQHQQSQSQLLALTDPYTASTVPLLDRETMEVVQVVHAKSPKQRIFAGLEKA